MDEQRPDSGTGERQPRLDHRLAERLEDGSRRPAADRGLALERPMPAAMGERLRTSGAVTA